LRWGQRGGLETEIAVALQHLALLSSLANNDRRAVKLLGYVDAQFDAHRSKREPTEQWGCDKLVSALRAKLSADDLAELSAEGAAWSEDQALQEALSEVHE
jgi:hypothetical protein